MKLTLLALAAALASVISGCRPSEALAAPAAGEGPGIAVVELFTSEGCSSCPSADVVLGELAARARAPASRIFPLAFHVDYWNSLGWTDRFSSEAASDRQRAYAASFGTSSVYTPQMVVDGTEEFVGSDRARASAAIARALARPEALGLSVSADAQAGDGRTLVVRYHVGPSGSSMGDALVRIAAVEKGLVTNVAGGENSRRRLEHENVVRAFATERAKAEGSSTLHLPAAIDWSRLEVIAFVQSAKAVGRGMPVLAAARARVVR